MATINFYLGKFNFNRIWNFNIDGIDPECFDFQLTLEEYKPDSLQMEFIKNNPFIPFFIPTYKEESVMIQENTNFEFLKQVYDGKCCFKRANFIDNQKKPIPLSTFSQALRIVEQSSSHRIAFNQIKTYPDCIYAPLRFSHENDEASTLEKYIDGIITKGDLAICAKYPLGISGWSENSTTHNPFWMSYLKGKVPVLLVPSALMPAGDGIDSLGCYIPNLSLRKPVIFLCPEKIKEEANRSGIPINELYAVVLIHEFAHAVMDETNTLKDEDKKVVFEKTEDSVEISKAAAYMEESLANMITLQYMEIANQDYLEAIKNFMRNQPAPYAFGVDLFDANKDAILIDWRKWRTYKSISHQSVDMLNNWKDFVDHPIHNEPLEIVKKFSDVF